MQHEFPMIPPASHAVWPMFLGAAVMFGACLLFLFLATFMGHEKFLISPAGLQITNSLYGRSIPASKLLLDQARPVDFLADPEFRLGFRRNGSGSPDTGPDGFRCRIEEMATKR